MEISPFTIDVPEADVRDLKTRLANTRWPSDVVSDWSRARRRHMPEGSPIAGRTTSTGRPSRTA